MIYNEKDIITDPVESALNYHSNPYPGKLEVVPSKACDTQADLALAYSPGVAEPCLKIANNPMEAYRYTIKGNLVAIISNGTAVLGLGNLGALASKPVMEGKAMLMKKYAGIDSYDIELNTNDIDVFVRTVITMSPTFGAINLEDIKAPECFEIERRLVDVLDIPVMHDDQHGTAVVTAAGMMNAIELAGKKPEEIRLVVNGAGAAAMACADMLLALGVKKENLVMLDSKGVISADRIDLDKYKQRYAVNTAVKTLEQAVVGADAFLGLSKGNIMTPAMVHSMAEHPIVFALANPNPEIAYNDAIKAKYGILYATGRSDIPNQVNNVLGFPYIFRAALDVRATTINMEMKKAAALALASLAKETYLNPSGEKTPVFGREYFIPKPSDPRLLKTITVAVAKAAIISGVAQQPITDFELYKKQLEQRIRK